MSRKNRPNKNQPKKLGPQPVQMQSAPPVTMGNVAVNFIREVTSWANELEGRRALDADVGEYLKEKNLVDEFNAWRTAKHAPAATTEPKKA